MAICFASSGYKTKLECIEVHKRTSMLFIYYLVNIFLVKSLCKVSMVSLGWRRGQIICAADQRRGWPFLGLLSHICESRPSSVLCIWRPLMVVQLCKITAFTMEISRPNLNSDFCKFESVTLLSQLLPGYVDDILIFCPLWPYQASIAESPREKVDCETWNMWSPSWVSLSRILESGQVNTGQRKWNP